MYRELFRAMAQIVPQGPGLKKHIRVRILQRKEGQWRREGEWTTETNTGSSSFTVREESKANPACLSPAALSLKSSGLTTCSSAFIISGSSLSFQPWFNEHHVADIIQWILTTFLRIIISLFTEKHTEAQEANLLKLFDSKALVLVLHLSPSCGSAWPSYNGHFMFAKHNRTWDAVAENMGSGANGLGLNFSFAFDELGARGQIISLYLFPHHN